MNDKPLRSRRTLAKGLMQGLGLGLVAPVVPLLGLLPRRAGAQIKTGDNPGASVPWQKVRKSVFGTRDIVEAAEVVDGVIALDLPVRAEDAAVVPLAVKARFAQGSARNIRKLYLVIDNNPSPIAAIFEFTPQSGRADIETRIRVDEYSHVRAIAETDDGRLFMAVRWVKASGGCSAPPGKDAQAALASMGRMRWRVEGDVNAAAPVLAQLMISHPNNSGLAMDQLSRQYTPAHYVRKVDISYAGQPLLSADMDISISENPNLRFYFVPRTAGELKAEVVDSRDLRFASSFSHKPQP
jgi:sulfur-oxidizing protein SoxY